MEHSKFSKMDCFPFPNQNVPSRLPTPYSNFQINSLPEHFIRQNNHLSIPRPVVPRPTVPPEPPGTTNAFSPAVPPRSPIVVGNIPFQNSNNHFQPPPPFQHQPPIPPSTQLHTSSSSTQNNHRPLYNVPPPSIVPAGYMDPTHFGQFNFPPPPVSMGAPQYHGFAKSESPFPINPPQQYINNVPVQGVFPGVSNQPSSMFQIISNIQSNSKVPESETSEKENLLNNFLQKFSVEEKQEPKREITVAEFRSGLKKCLSLFHLLQSSRGSLVSLLDSNQEKWEIELKKVKVLEDTLSEACSLFLAQNNLIAVKKKLKAVKRKRALKKKLKSRLLEEKTKKEQERERLHQEIDKWFDNLKEKNEKMKRETEMKKEADNILAEVRRKIHDAKKTIEKLKVFEKLRSARQANAVQKGLHVQADHSAKFEEKICHLRETMLAQLSNYEQEEKALQVMLETEQEDRREEEALWRKRKLMTFQQKKQKTILQSLFGNDDEPAPEDDLYLFYQYQNSGNKSIDNLLQIRHHWDIHLSGEGESIPLQWVVPVPPSGSSWVEYCTS